LWIVICATKRQLKKLAKARRWEADGTFSIVPQALTIALFNYVEKYWIKHAIWKPKMWSSFNVAIRTVLDTDT
jgi:hypothetical protein